MPTIYVREVEDALDQQLLDSGWKMAGFALWHHANVPGFYSKARALEINLGENYHPIEVEHAKLLAFVHDVLSTNETYEDVKSKAENLLMKLRYIS